MIYVLDIILWIIRLLAMFAVNKTLGPYVGMISKMVSKDTLRVQSTQ